MYPLGRLSRSRPISAPSVRSFQYQTRVRDKWRSVAGLREDAAMTEQPQQQPADAPVPGEVVVGEPTGPQATESIPSPAKVMRIGAMVRQLLEEVRHAPLDEAGRALVDACQEAAFNAARHSGAPLVSVYVEVEPDELTGFVRDEGKGFDPDQVPTDRRGIADSIRGRIRRHGGSVAIISSPGEGTEVQLRLPRSQG